MARALGAERCTTDPIYSKLPLDKATGARDLGFGLDIADFLLEPEADEADGCITPYHCGDAFHGELVKRYVELPQICTQAAPLEYKVTSGQGWICVRQWYHYREANYGRKTGSRWEQTLLFRDGVRYFLSADRITSVNTVDRLIFRLDMPGHLKHDRGREFETIYLSYHGCIPSSEFIEDFPPDARFLYQRGPGGAPDTMIRAYQVRRDDSPGPWLGGITLDPSVVFEAWCHQRGYVCFIEEVGGEAVEAGTSFGAAYAVGWFDTIDDMTRVAHEHRGMREIDVARFTDGE
ncbi:MAG: hypothetical protein HN742_29750 [Lentisphaerae bacterium]|nr:hypothetical protein [Lentisphaerota bacterium]MBT5612776.1 hypothetical protein [Lentisphaerota bacterium]MBT7053992.1 hypothetical protein [Lentisphaerota bacterium]MBT7846093.1 hypothetical protein [Lentisphaerota bacterium]